VLSAKDRFYVFSLYTVIPPEFRQTL